ncbi:MAG: hypothetical protein RL095_3251 [Verrucomicrobiota bacterium]|jgi:hypothetical protein
MHDHLTRRSFLSGSALGLGSLAFGALFAQGAEGAQPVGPHFPAKAKRVIYLHQAGAPPQMELFDYKPGLAKWHGKRLPDSFKKNLTFSVAGADQEPLIVPSLKPFKQYGQSGRWMCESIPHIGSLADDICIIDSMHTEHINHAPAITLLQSGSPIPGRPSMGSWASYGLGSMNADLPAFVVLSSVPTFTDCGQPLYEHLWSSGFLPAEHQGTKLRAGSAPVLHVKNPEGMPAEAKRAMVDALSQANRAHFDLFHDPEISARVTQAELAFRMQTSVPDLIDFSKESPAVLDSYGPMVRTPGTYAYNCLLARRLAERNVRFIQLYHTGWDFHGHITTQLPAQIQNVDQPTAALIKDLKQRGLLDDTLVVWGGEFGRTVCVQGNIKDTAKFGRDHHGNCFTTWMAGAGVKAGHSHGTTDDFSVSVVDKGVHVHDLQATILERLGFDHTRLTARYQGRDFRLTDVHGHVVKELLS